MVGIEETVLKCENSLSSGLLLEKTSRLEETSRAQFLHSLLVSPIIHSNISSRQGRPLEETSREKLRFEEMISRWKIEEKI